MISMFVIAKAGLEKYSVVKNINHISILKTLPLDSNQMLSYGHHWPFPDAIY